MCVKCVNYFMKVIAHNYMRFMKFHEWLCECFRDLSSQFQLYTPFAKAHDYLPKIFFLQHTIYWCTDVHVCTFFFNIHRIAFDGLPQFQTRGGLKPERIDPSYGDVESE